MAEWQGITHVDMEDTFFNDRARVLLDQLATIREVIEEVHRQVIKGHRILVPT